MSVEKISLENQLWYKFKLDDYTKKEIIKLNHSNERDCFKYFEKLFNILHKDILKESKNRYAEYIIKHTELKNNLKELTNNKNIYEYKYYIIMYNDIEKEIEKNMGGYYGLCDSGFKHLGKAKFLIDEKYYDKERLTKKLNKLKEKLHYAFL